MAPFDDASCSGSTTGQSLTTSWNRIFTSDDTQHQDRLRPTASSNGLGETMRSRPSSLTEESEVQEAFNEFENQKPNFLADDTGRNDQHDQVNFEKAWAAANNEHTPALPPAEADTPLQQHDDHDNAEMSRPFAEQYAEVDELLQQPADLQSAEEKHKHSDSLPCCFQSPSESLSQLSALTEAIDYLEDTYAFVFNYNATTQEPDWQKLTDEDCTMPDVNEDLERRRIVETTNKHEQNPSNTPNTELTHHSAMFHFLQKLYRPRDQVSSTFNLDERTLRWPALRAQALNILKMRDEEELQILRRQFPDFHGELYAALEEMRQEYEEVVENEAGNWVLIHKGGENAKAKL